MHPHVQHPPTSASTHGAALQSGKLIRLPSVENLTGLKRSAIYAAMRAGTFPGSVRLSVLDQLALAPSILTRMGVAVPPSMKAKPFFTA